MRFSLGVNYWPRRSAMEMWQRFDAGEIAEDFARIAALGLDTVRFFLRWADFQPAPDTMDSVMLDRFATVCDLAAAAGLRVMPTLYTGHMSGVNWLPSWTLDRDMPHGRFRTITERGESPYGIGDFYVGELLEAQVVFARAAGKRVAKHPAILAWDLGNEFSNMREPALDLDDAAAWSRRLTDVLETTSGCPVIAGTHGEDITRERDIRLSTLCAPHAFATMHGYTVYSDFARDRLDPEVVPFLAATAAAMARKPLLFSEFGNPTCPPGKRTPFERVPLPDEPPVPCHPEPVEGRTIAADDSGFASYACLTETEMAAYCTAVLDRLHADGRLGAYWWCWADYADALREEPPFDRAPHELSFGIIRSDGSAKPVVAALSAFAREGRSVVEPVDVPINEDAYYDALPAATHEAFARFLEVKSRA